MSTRRYYPKDTTIEGNVGGVFFIIMDGVVSVEREGKDPRHLTLGDSFGEISAMTVESETMKMTAVTDVFIAEFNCFAFHQYLSSAPEIKKRLKYLEAMRQHGFSSVCRDNSLFRDLTFPQRRELQSICKVRTCKRDEKVYSIGVDAKTVALVESGCFVILGPDAARPDAQDEAGPLISAENSVVSGSHTGDESFTEDGESRMGGSSAPPDASDVQSLGSQRSLISTNSQSINAKKKYRMNQKRKRRRSASSWAQRNRIGGMCRQIYRGTLFLPTKIYDDKIYKPAFANNKSAFGKKEFED